MREERRDKAYGEKRLNDLAHDTAAEEAEKAGEDKASIPPEPYPPGVPV